MNKKVRKKFHKKETLVERAERKLSRKGWRVVKRKGRL